MLGAAHTVHRTGRRLEAWHCLLREPALICVLVGLGLGVLPLGEVEWGLVLVLVVLANLRLRGHLAGAVGRIPKLATRGPALVNRDVLPVLHVPTVANAVQLVLRGGRFLRTIVDFGVHLFALFSREEVGVLVSFPVGLTLVAGAVAHVLWVTPAVRAVICLMLASDTEHRLKLVA